MTAALLDTSVFVALESGRPMLVERMPAEVMVSIVTIAELEAGVLAAGDVETRSRRLATLHNAALLSPVVVDGAAARTWARMRAVLAEHRRRVGVNDLWIAATAAAAGVAVVTQDDGFDVLAELGLVEVVKV